MVRVFSKPAPDAEDWLRRLFTLLLEHAARERQAAPVSGAVPSWVSEGLSTYDGLFNTTAWNQTEGFRALVNYVYTNRRDAITQAPALWWRCEVRARPALSDLSVRGACRDLAGCGRMDFTGSKRLV